MPRAQIVLPQHKCRSIVSFLCLIILLIGFVGMAGWVVDNPIMKSFSLNWIAIKFNTAVCIIFIALSMWILKDEAANSYARIVAKLFAVIVLVTSILTLIEYVFHVDLYLDQLFFVEKSYGEHFFPGRMSLVTAICFIAASLSLLLLDNKLLPKWSHQIFAGIIISLAMISIQFFIFNIKPDYISISYFNMAFGTTIAFLLFSLCLLLKNPYVGISLVLLEDTISGSMGRSLFPLIFILPIFIVFIVNQGQYKLFYNEEFSHAIISLQFIFIAGIIVYINLLLIRRKEKEMEKAQSELQERDILFNEFAENIDSVLWRATSTLDKIIYVSPAYEKIWGRSANYLYTHPEDWIEAIVPEDRQRVFDSFINKFKQGILVSSFEFKIQSQEGSIHNIIARSFPIKNSQGDLSGIIGITTDITSTYRSMLKNRLIYDIHKSLSHTSDIKQSGLEILKLICYALNFTIGEIWLFNKDKNTLNILVDWHKEKSLIRSIPKKPIDVSEKNLDAFPFVCFQHDVIQYSTYSHHLMNATHPKHAYGINLKECIGFPLRTPNENIGVIIFYNSRITEQDKDMYDLLNNIAHQLSEHTLTISSKMEIDRLMKYDLLTGIYNRSEFIKTINKLIENTQSTFAIVKITFNNLLRDMNETMGYEAGNEFLLNMTRKISDILTFTPHVFAKIETYRFGIVLTKVESSKTIIDVVTRLLDLSKYPININNMEVYVLLNIGISIYPINGGTSDSLMASADLAVEESVKLGSNNFQFATNESIRQLTKKINIQNMLHKALINNEFELYYQPKIALSTGRITSVEALIRWNHPSMGLLLPKEFISICENSDLIYGVGEFVLRSAITNIICKLPIQVSVNLSMRQLNERYNLVETIKKIFTDLDANPEFLELEITETILMNNLELTHRILSQLRNLHIKISIDDFGTGYSSFKYLQEFRPNSIKIDKSFIDRLPYHTPSLEIIKGIISLAHKLNIKVIAEGVENVGQVNCLKKAKCDEIQGYYFSEPLPLNKLKEFIEMNRK